MESFAIIVNEFCPLIIVSKLSILDICRGPANASYFGFLKQNLLFLVHQLENVDASITVPIPLGDFQLSGAGTWSYGDTKLKVKFLKDMNGYYSIKGYAETGKDI